MTSCRAATDRWVSPRMASPIHWTSWLRVLLREHSRRRWRLHRSVDVQFRGNIDNMRPCTPRRLVWPYQSVQRRRARTGSEVEDPTAAADPKTPGALRNAQRRAAGFSRLDNRTWCRSAVRKATQRAVSADWLWRAALARDFPAHVQKLCINQGLHPQRIWRKLCQIVEITRTKTRRVLPEGFRATLLFALPSLEESDGQETAAMWQFRSQFSYRPRQSSRGTHVSHRSSTRNHLTSGSWPWPRHWKYQVRNCLSISSLSMGHYN